MGTEVAKIDLAQIDSAKVRKAADLVDAGKLVAFPTETVYGIACRLEPEALNRLNNLKGRTPDKYYTLHIGQKSELPKYVPNMRLRAKKLIKNAWPGPLTIVFELSDEDLVRQKETLDKGVFQNLYRNNSVGIRCPDHPVASMLLQLAKNPIVAPSANVTGKQPAVDAEGVLEQFSGQIEMLLDAGPCKYEKNSTVVKIGNYELEILREGVYSGTELNSLSAIQILFVCTGNTCRSPMAEGLFSKYLAEKLHCAVDQLAEKGYKICSAGTLGIAGVPVSLESVAACAAKGIDIKEHRSSTLTRRLAEESDFIFAMSREHYEQITAFDEEIANKCTLLVEASNVPDPIGQSQQIYNSCADLIESAIKKKISEIVI